MKIYRLPLIFMSFFLLLGACNPATPTLPGVTGVPTGDPPGQTAAVTPTVETPEATRPPTITPLPLPQVILLSPDENGGTSSSSAALLEIIQPALAQLALAQGLHFETQPTLADSSLAGARIVVAMSGAAGIAELANAHPQVQFVSLGASGMQPGANLSVISDAAFSSRLFFAAGYLGALITPDWRVGALLPAGAPEQAAWQAALTNGSAFFCGLCRPAYPPYESYPKAATLTAQASEAEVQAAVNDLVGRGVQTLFLAPGVGGETLYTYLAQKNVQVIGSTAPPAALGDAWVVSLQPGWAEALEAAWPGLLAGEPGQQFDLPVGIDYSNPERLSPGRLRLLQDTLADLNSGYIEEVAPGP